jgi:sulfite reductase (NADPH) hemoprotein beta-component
VLAAVASRYSRGFCHITTRQNIQYHFVPLAVVETVMRDLAKEGLTTREACGNSVRNITGCPYTGIAHDEVFDVTPYAEALTRYFLRHPLAAKLPRKFKIAFEGCAQDHALASINDLGWRARIEDGRRGFRVTVAGGTSIMPVSGYVLYEFLPVEDMYNVAGAERTTLNQLFGMRRERVMEHRPEAADAEPVYAEFRPGDVRHSEADISRIRDGLGYRPSHGVREGLLEATRWYAEHQAEPAGR